MSTFDWIELGFIIVEFLSILVEIGLQIYEIVTSKKMEQNLMDRMNQIEQNLENKMKGK